MTEPLSGFAVWLLGQGYRAQTVYEYDRLARRLLELGASPPRTQADFAALLRFADFAEDPGSGATGLERASAEVARSLSLRPKGSRVGRRREAQAKQTSRSVSIPDAEWIRLCDALREISGAGSREAAALEVMAATGLRVGDLLSVSRMALVDAAKAGRVHLATKGGKRRVLPFGPAWQALWKRWRETERAASVEAGWWPTVGHWVTGRPGDKASAAALGERDGAGYKRLARALDSAAKAAGVSGRVHLHRLRRTVAVQALRVTRDTSTVQQMLGHANIATTSQYLDEARPDDLAELEGQIASRFRSEKLA